MKVVNQDGLVAIRAFLLERHQCGEHMTEENILAWAAEAERHLEDNGVAFIELKARDSVGKQTELFYLEDEWLDECEEEES